MIAYSPLSSQKSDPDEAGKRQSNRHERVIPENLNHEFLRPNVYSDKNILHYEMNKFPRGLATIISVGDFQDSSKTHYGMDKDATRMKNLFLDLGFMVDQYNNLSKSELLNALNEAAEEDYSDLCCYACITLSHGHKGVVYGNDSAVKITELIEPFC